MMQSQNCEPPKLPARYRNLDLLAASDRSTVYVARDDESGEDVVLKVFDESATSVYMQEAAICLQLDHPGLVRCLDSFYTADGHGVVVFEYMQLGTLSDLLAANDGRLGVDECCSCIRQILQTLCYLHTSGLIHADIKPENIFVDTSTDGSFRYLIGDVGNCCQLSAASQGNVDSGTPAYCAPEVTLRQQTEASDLYSLGILAFQIRQGKLPFLGTVDQIRRQHLNAAIALEEVDDPRYRELLCAFLQKDPHHRLSTAEHAIHVIDGIFGSGAAGSILSRSADSLGKALKAFDMKLIAQPAGISHQYDQDCLEILVDYGSFSDVESTRYSRCSVYSPLGSDFGGTQGVISYSPTSVSACRPGSKKFETLLHLGCRAKLVCFENEKVFWSDGYSYYLADIQGHQRLFRRDVVLVGGTFRQHARVLSGGIAVSEGELADQISLYDFSLEAVRKILVPGSIIEMKQSGDDLMVILLDPKRSNLYGLWVIDLLKNRVREIEISGRVRLWNGGSKGLTVLLSSGELLEVTKNGAKQIGSTNLQGIVAFSHCSESRSYVLLFNQGTGNYRLECHQY